MKQKTSYKLPTIVRPANGDWHVVYKFEYPDRPGYFKTLKVRDGVNYIHDPEKKERQIQQLRDDIQYALEKENYNPFKQLKVVRQQIEVKKQQTEAKHALMRLDEQ